MEIVEELVPARVERPDEHADLPARLHDLFPVQAVALELGYRRLLVPHQQLDLDAGRDPVPRWGERVILDG